MNLDRLSRTLRVVVSSACLATAALAIAGCGESEGPKHAKVAPGPMPEDEQWTGVYFHPVYGYLHLQEEGNNIVGRWKRTDHSYWGEMKIKVSVVLAGLLVCEMMIN